MKNSKLLTLICLLLSATAVLAGEFDYPELSMAPRYSERLKTEAGKENQAKWTQHAPIQISAITTFIAGVTQIAGPDKSKDTSGTSGLFGIGIGGAWLGVTFFLSQGYTPYSSAIASLEKMASQSPRDRLAKERYAESIINETSSLARKLTWLSFITNAGACGYMTSQSKASSLSQVMDLSCLVFSAAPLLFKYNWAKISEEQGNYKKQIYGPIASQLIEVDPKTGKPSAGLQLSFLF